MSTYVQFKLGELTDQDIRLTAAQRGIVPGFRSGEIDSGEYLSSLPLHRLELHRNERVLGDFKQISQVAIAEWNSGTEVPQIGPNLPFAGFLITVQAAR